MSSASDYANILETMTKIQKVADSSKKHDQAIIAFTFFVFCLQLVTLVRVFVRRRCCHSPFCRRPREQAGHVGALQPLDCAVGVFGGEMGVRWTFPRTFWHRRSLTRCLLLATLLATARDACRTAPALLGVQDHASQR